MQSVFIIDDHPVIRLAVRMLLENEGYCVVGESDNGVDAMQMVRECLPDLIILDISIPRLDGLEVLSRFHSMAIPPENPGAHRTVAGVVCGTLHALRRRRLCM